MKTVDLLKVAAGMISCCTLFNCSSNNNKGNFALGVTPDEGLQGNGGGGNGDGCSGGEGNNSIVESYNQNEIGGYGASKGLDISSEKSLYESYTDLMESVNKGIVDIKLRECIVNDISRFKGLLDNNRITIFPYTGSKSQCYKAIFKIHETLCEILEKEKSTQPPKYKFSDKFDSLFAKLKDFLTKEDDCEKNPVEYLDIVSKVLYETSPENPIIIGQYETMSLEQRKLFMDKQGVKKTVEEYIKDIDNLLKNSKERRESDVNKLKTRCTAIKADADTAFTDNETLINSSKADFREDYAYKNTISVLRGKVKEVEQRVDATKKQSLIKFVDSSSPNKYAYNETFGVDITSVFDNVYNNIKNLQEVVKNVKSAVYDEKAKKELLQKDYNEIINSMLEFIIYGIEANQWLIAIGSLKPELYYLTKDDKGNDQIEKKITNFFNYFTNEGSAEKTDFYVNKDFKELFGKIKVSFEAEYRKLKQETGQNNANEISLKCISEHITKINDITRKDSAARQFFIKLELLYNTFLNGHSKYTNNDEIKALVKRLLRYSGNDGDAHFRNIGNANSLERLLGELATAIEADYGKGININNIKNILDRYNDTNESYNDRDGISPSDDFLSTVQCTDLNTLDLIFSNLVKMQKEYYKDLRLNDDYRKNINTKLGNISEFFIDPKPTGKGIVNILFNVLNDDHGGTTVLGVGTTYRVSSYQVDIVKGFCEDLKKMVFKPGNVVNVDEKFQAFENASTDTDIINNSSTFAYLFREVFVSPFKKIADFMNGNVADKEYMNENLYIGGGVTNLGNLLNSIDDAIGDYNSKIVAKIFKNKVDVNDKYVFKLSDTIDLSSPVDKNRATKFDVLELPASNDSDKDICKNQLKNLETLSENYGTIKKLSDRIYYFSNAICALYKSLPSDMQKLVYSEDVNNKVGSGSFGKLIDRLVDIQYRMFGDIVHIISNVGKYRDFLKNDGNLVQLDNMKDNKFKFFKPGSGDVDISFTSSDQTIYKPLSPLLTRLCFTNEVLKNNTSLNDLFIHDNDKSHTEDYYSADKVKQTLFIITGLEKYRNSSNSKVWADRVLTEKGNNTFIHVVGNQIDSNLEKRLESDVTKIIKGNSFFCPAYKESWMFNLLNTGRLFNFYFKKNSGFFITASINEKGKNTPENGIYYFPYFFKQQAKDFKVNDEGEFVDNKVTITMNTFDNFVKYLKKAWEKLTDDGVEFKDLELIENNGLLIDWNNGHHNRCGSYCMYRYKSYGAEHKMECEFKDNAQLRHLIAGTLDGIGDNDKLAKAIDKIIINKDVYKNLVKGYRELLKIDTDNKYYKAARDGACKVISESIYRFADDNVKYKLCDVDTTTSAFDMVVSQHFAQNCGVEKGRSEKCKNVANICAAVANIRRNIILNELIRNNEKNVTEVLEEVENKIKGLKIADILGNIDDINFKNSCFRRVLNYMKNSSKHTGGVTIKDEFTESQLKNFNLLTAGVANSRDTYKLVYKKNDGKNFDEQPLKEYINKFQVAGNDISNYSVQGGKICIDINNKLFKCYKERMGELRDLLADAAPVTFDFGTNRLTQVDIIDNALTKMVKMYVSPGGADSEVKTIEDKAQANINGTGLHAMIANISNISSPSSPFSNKILFYLLFVEYDGSAAARNKLINRMCEYPNEVPLPPNGIDTVVDNATKFKNACSNLYNTLNGYIAASKVPEILTLGKTKNSKKSSDVKELIDLLQGVNDLKNLIDKFGTKDLINDLVNSVCTDEKLQKLVKDVNILINGGGQTMTTGHKITNGFKSLGTVFKGAFKDIVDEDIVGYWNTDIKDTDVEKLFGEKKTMKVNEVFEELCNMVDLCSEEDRCGTILREIVEGKLKKPGIPLPPLVPGLPSNMYNFVEDGDTNNLTFDNINKSLLKEKLGVELKVSSNHDKYELSVDGTGKDGLGHVLKELKIFDYKDVDTDKEEKDKKLEDLFTNLYRIKGIKPTTS